MAYETKGWALVTGSSRGIGYHTAAGLAVRGYDVFVSATRVEAARDAAYRIRTDADVRNVFPLELDISNSRSIESCLNTVVDVSGRLDILVNNAGVRVEPYGVLPSEQGIDLWSRTFATNLFGTVAVTQTFLPLLRTSPNGRIVNVSSMLGSIGVHSDPESYIYTDKFKSLPAYSAAKSALNSWTVHLAYELSNTRVKVNSAHPGYSKTDMNEGDGSISAAEGAMTSIALATFDDDGPSGKFFHMGEELPW